jgi:hypothetical protein
MPFSSDMETIYHVSIHDFPAKAFLVGASETDALFYRAVIDLLRFAGSGAVLAGEPIWFQPSLI